MKKVLLIAVLGGKRNKIISINGVIKIEEETEGKHEKMSSMNNSNNNKKNREKLERRG